MLATCWAGVLRGLGSFYPSEAAYRMGAPSLWDRGTRAQKDCRGPWLGSGLCAILGGHCSERYFAEERGEEVEMSRNLIVIAIAVIVVVVFVYLILRLL